MHDNNYIFLFLFHRIIDLKKTYLEVNDSVYWFNMCTQLKIDLFRHVGPRNESMLNIYWNIFNNFINAKIIMTIINK